MPRAADYTSLTRYPEKFPFAKAHSDDLITGLPITPALTFSLQVRCDSTPRPPVRNGTLWYANRTLEKLGSPENHRHYPGLDGLRGVAVLLVFFQHYIPVPPEATWGWVGVRIFFALSGFLITGILYDTRNAERRWSVFYARRALRIFPLYYGVLLAAALLYPITQWKLSSSYWLWPLYLQNFARYFWPASQVMTGHIDHLYSARFTPLVPVFRFGHFWSLAVEEQFYLLWPFVVFAVKRRDTLMKICLAVVVITPLIRLACAFLVSPTWLKFGFQERFTFVQFDALLIGAFFSLWLRGPHPDLTRIAYRALAFIASIFVIAEVVCIRVYHYALTPNIAAPTFGSVGISCVDVFGAALVLVAIDSTTPFSRFLQGRFLRHLGAISYGFYVFHDMFHDFYGRIPLLLHIRDPHGLTTGVIGFIGTLLVANLSFRFFEAPFLALKRRFRVTASLPQ